MDNFIYKNQTKIIFGKETHKTIGAEIAQYYKKVLLHYGGGSIKKSGLYDDVIASLKDANITYIELSGVVPNPVLSLVNEGIALCRNHDIELVLAVGGGSVGGGSVGGGGMARTSSHCPGVLHKPSMDHDYRPSPHRTHRCPCCRT